MLADLLRTRDPKRAAAALTLFAELAPHEYFLIAPRVLAAAPLWSFLEQSTRDVLLDDKGRYSRSSSMAAIAPNNRMRAPGKATR